MNKTQNFWNKQAKRYDYSERQFEPVFKEIIAKTRKILILMIMSLTLGVRQVLKL